MALRSLRSAPASDRWAVCAQRELRCYNPILGQALTQHDATGTGDSDSAITASSHSRHGALTARSLASVLQPGASLESRPSVDSCSSGHSSGGFSCICICCSCSNVRCWRACRSSRSRPGCRPDCSGGPAGSSCREKECWRARRVAGSSSIRGVIWRGSSTTLQAV